MCVAVYKPKTIVVSKETLLHCFEQNPHGAGFAVPEVNGKSMKISKGIFEFEEFWSLFEPFNNIDTPAIIHFRVATSGNVDGANCHPWRINKRVAMIHNGNLAKTIGITHPDVSDTGLYAANILKPMIDKYRGSWRVPAFKWIVEEYFGNNNKMVIMDAAGNAVIFNESKGEWHESCWFSNKTYEKPRTKVQTSYNCVNTNTYYAAGTKYEGEVAILPVLDSDIIHKEPPERPPEPQKDDLNLGSDFLNPAKSATIHRPNSQSGLTGVDDWFDQRGICAKDYI